MQRHGSKIILTLGSLLLLLASCAPAETAVTSSPAESPDVLYQVSTLKALMQGYYDGVITVDELLQHGDVGLGTFDGLDGEMTVLDGQVYQFKGDGTLVAATGEISTPFATVTNFDAEITLNSWQDIPDIATLKARLDESIAMAGNNPNCFYLLTLTGEFPQVQVRSEKAQSKPYRPLAAVMAEDQTEFTYENISGTVVGLWCPQFVDGLNMPGWHLHFISADRSQGGHILEIAVGSATATLDSMEQFNLLLPDDAAFAALDLTADMAAATAQVESGSTATE